MNAVPSTNNNFFPDAALIRIELVVKHTECMYIGAKHGREDVFKRPRPTGIRHIVSVAAAHRSNPMRLPTPIG